MNASLIEKDFTFVSFSGRALYENSYFLEQDRKISLPTTGSVLEAHYFYATAMENNGIPFYFAAQRNGDSDGRIFLNTFNADGSVITSDFQLAVNFESDQSKGPAAIQLENRDVLIFGNEAFYKINVSETGAISEEWSKQAEYGLISDAKPYNEGFILCNEAGKLVHVDDTGTELWEEDLGYALRAVLVLEDGFLLAGSINETTAIIKTSFSGTISWELEYDGTRADDLVLSDDGNIVFTGSRNSNIFATKINKDGGVIWTEEYSEGVGVDLTKSKYGGYIIQGKNFLSNTIIRLREDGTTGELSLSKPVKTIEANNIRSSTTNSGALFWDGDNVSYSFPKGAETTTIFTGGLWIAGRDQNGNFHSAISEFFNSDFSPGPFGSNSTEWDNIWKITKAKVADLRADFEDGVYDRAIPTDFLTYPGAGNPNFNFYGGQATVPDDMAPFVDVNNDGIYNIFDGDYPDIKGDEMLWWVMNDEDGGAELDAVAFDFQYKCSFYAYNCNANDVLYNSSFLDIDITSFSDNQYTDLYLGTFLDFDIGCFRDDYFGTLPTSNAVYSYNEDGTDGSSSCGTPQFSTGEILVQSVVLLNQNLDHAIYYANQALTNPDVGAMPPDNAAELHRFLQSTWIDGTPLTVGGTGYGGVDPTNYVFSGNPSNFNDWTMCSEGISPSDRWLIMSTGPHTLDFNETIELDLGLLTHEDVNYPCPNIDPIALEIQTLQSLYDDGGLDYTLNLGTDQTIMSGEMITLDAGDGADSYKWSDGTEMQRLEVTEPGLYSVTITTVSGCEYTDEITISSFVSTAELINKAPKIYPNPVRNQLFVEFGEEVPEYISIENTLGQNLQTVKVAAGIQNSTLELNIGELSQGLYLIRFHFDTSKKVQLRKFVIAN